MKRRQILLGAGAATVLQGAWNEAMAQGKEVVIGALYPMSGPSAQVGIDARQAFETALEVINNVSPLDLPTAKNAGLARLGGAKVRVVYADHQADPQKGRAEAERLITQENVCAIVGCYHSSVSTTVSATCERYGVPFVCADSSSPTLSAQGLKFFFRTAAHDEMFSQAMFDFMDALKARGQKIGSVGLFYEDTIFGSDSAKVQRKLAAERGYRIACDIKYRNNSPSLTAEVQQIKNANPDVLMPSSYTTDTILLAKTMAELGYRPPNIVAQAAGFVEKPALDAVGDKLVGMISRASFSEDMGEKRPSAKAVNASFKARAGRDLNDQTSRQFSALMVLADAIDRAGTVEPGKIREALAATDIPGDKTIMPWARVKFDAHGQNTFASPVLIQWNKAKFVTVYPFEVATAKVVWPMNG
ncbi:ABC transporter substrate-binding protein [Xylophilus rhododendri]|uniref:ABC transporter substrate-binding protein n=1 Tax=Xylophilus rhododendri TaxID=2697032 RepID=A0A857J7M0_9BURK|nr:ABC transporter substrate-binding protein [Xylophilus rhododendri]QHI99707.1 ABC transporter substrate-binding protein [Xylophilus rhododendri]